MSSPNNNDAFDLDEIKLLLGDEAPPAKTPAQKKAETTAQKNVQDKHKNDMSKKKKKKKMARKQKALIAIGCVCAAIVVLLGGLAIFINSWLGLMKPLENHQMSNPVGSSGQFTLAPEDTLPTDFTISSDATLATSPVPIIETPDIINIMLLGEDDTGGYARGRTDAMLLCSINKKTNTISLVSFLRDTYLTIPGYGHNRLNTAYINGGVETFKETMLWNFGVQIDDVVMVGFSAFDDVVEILGGVDLELTRAEANHLRQKYGYQLKEGMNHLNGEQAFNYARIRSIDSDFGRVERQQKVLEAIFNAYKGKPLLELLDVTRKILPNLSSTMSNDTVLSYVASLFPMLADCSLERYRMPIDGAWYDEKVTEYMWVIIPDLQKCQEALKEIISP